METHDDSDGAVTDALTDWLNEHVGGPVDPNYADYIDADEGGDAGAYEARCHQIHMDQPDWDKATASSLAHNGFAVLHLGHHCLSPGITSACSTYASERMDFLFKCARALGLRPQHDVLRYSELCSRRAGGMRYDMRLWTAAHAEHDEPTTGQTFPECWSKLQTEVEVIVRPVLRQYLCERSNSSSSTAQECDQKLFDPCHEPCIDSVGCVTALPGAPDQHFHPDGTAIGLVNVFVPLCPVGYENGPTELQPGSHVWRETAFGSKPRWDERKTHPVSPVMPIPGGHLLLFDYRCYHRGLANHSTSPRPIAYVAFSTRQGVSDSHNFPTDNEASIIREAASEAG